MFQVNQCKLLLHVTGIEDGLLLLDLHLAYSVRLKAGAFFLVPARNFLHPHHTTRIFSSLRSFSYLRLNQNVSYVVKQYP